VLIAVLGALFPVIALFLPMWTVTDARTGAESMQALWQREIGIQLAVMLVLISALAIGFGVAAALNIGTQERVTFWSMWGSALFLLVLAMMSRFTIGWILFPVSVLALVTCVHAVRACGVSPITETRDEDVPSDPRRLTES
jgi:hypothetical protein